MKAYGGKISSGYIGSNTQTPSCQCCNGTYAKVGRAKNKRNNLRGLKKSARQANRSIAVSELEEYELMTSKHEIRDIRFELEMQQSDECYHKELNSPETKFAETLYRFGLPLVNLYKCQCIDIYQLSDSEVLKLSGLI